MATVFPENVASVRVLEKLGFKFEQTIVEDGMLEHQYFLRVR